tara:strand:- start:788 stop:1105 length:318 start_codon:yes stop_codon:yes gene_type:complete
MSKFYNVTGNTGVTVELVSPLQSNFGIKSILLTNVHVTNDATVTLFIQDDPTSGVTSTYNLIHAIVVPAGSSLLLDETSIFRFDEKYGLYITVGSSDTVDVIIGT